MKFSETGLFHTPCNDWTYEKCPNYSEDWNKRVNQEICCHECSKTNCLWRCNLAKSFDDCPYKHEVL